ncbi:MAG: cytochrome c biogenesis protein CcsA [Verrucomicrobia subdivision 3 bacterium]|nr:cytochrome c biogenesis protein CcsA [Limisphaerales bacterium]
MNKWLPWVIAGVFGAWVLGTLRMPRDKDRAVTEFGRLPIVSNGRFQPIDSLARNSLLQIREKQTVRLADEKRSLTATEWLMELMMNQPKADTRKVFRIDHPDVKSMLRLPGKDRATGEDGKHYSWNQIKPSLEEIEKQAKRIAQVEPAHRNQFEQAVMKLQNSLFTYMRLRNTIHPEDSQNFEADLQRYLAGVESGVKAFRAKEAGRDHDETVLKEFGDFANRFSIMVRMDTPLLVPAPHPERSRDEWSRIGEALLDVIRGQPLPFAVPAYAKMATAYRQGRVADFNKAVSEYRAALAPKFAPELKKANREYFFNHLQAFYKALLIYIVAFILACASWFNMSDVLRRSAAWLVVVAFVVHTAGLLFRMFLEGRPPVTNLYSSAIFIGWGAVVLGMVLERFYRDGIGTVVASSVGFLTLIIAHHLALSGDTMQMMQAVLDTNFWLATHVVVVTLGYASTFVAGFLAIIYLIRGVFTKTLSPATSRALTRMVYGIICFATLFSFVGTVLGGIWADQSWGRFWGWDPKENGALIIVLWNALILHARWGGMVKERGLMNLAIVGNIVTCWSWFGVNMLNIGLHSYGFMGAAFWWLVAFVASQIVLIGLGLIPLRYWASFRALQGAGTKSGDEGLPDARPAPTSA